WPHVKSHVQGRVRVNAGVVRFFLLGWNYLTESFAGPYFICNLGHRLHCEFCRISGRSVRGISVSWLSIAATSLWQRRDFFLRGYAKQRVDVIDRDSEVEILAGFEGGHNDGDHFASAIENWTSAASFGDRR